MLGILNSFHAQAFATLIGSSGKGKSYFCKKLLLQQACNDVRIYILDPKKK